MGLFRLSRRVFGISIANLEECLLAALCVVAHGVHGGSQAVDVAVREQATAQQAHPGSAAEAIAPHDAIRRCWPSFVAEAASDSRPPRA